MAVRVPTRRARRVLRRAADHLSERRYHVRTRDRIYLEDLGVDGTDRLFHAPSDWLAVRHAFSRLELGADDVVVDYGCGLGRAVLIAASFPVRRVVGIELTEELAARARRNLEQSHRVRAREVEVVTADAVEWPVPPDVTVAYFYCPFVGEPFTAVVSRLIASLDEHPRALRIVYNLPVEHSFLIGTGRVQAIDAVPNLWLRRSRTGPRTIVTYLVLPADESFRRVLLDRYPTRLDGAEVWLGAYEPGYLLAKPDRLGGVFLDRPRSPAP
jgi:SAM-dependent methyltransferase